MSHHKHPIVILATLIVIVETLRLLGVSIHPGSSTSSPASRDHINTTTSSSKLSPSSFRDNPRPSVHHPSHDTTKTPSPLLHFATRQSCPVCPRASDTHGNNTTSPQGGLHKLVPPVAVSNMLKLMDCGHQNLQVPPLLANRPAIGHEIIIDIGLLDGKEFLVALDHGYGVYGFEPLVSRRLRGKCGHRCTYIKVGPDGRPHNPAISLPLPLVPPGHAYLIEAAAGATPGHVQMDTTPGGAASIVDRIGGPDALRDVPVVAVHDYVPVNNTALNIYLFKIDVQGYEYFALQGARDVFVQRGVKFFIAEFYPVAMIRSGVQLYDYLRLITHELGLTCFSSIRGDNFPKEHPVDGSKLAEWATHVNKDRGHHVHKGDFGIWDDLTCVNMNWLGN